MPIQAGEKAWARGEGPQVFALNVCPEKSARLPTRSLTLPWLIGSESSTQQRSEEQKLPPGGPQADRQAQGPESLLDLRKVRTKLGRRPGWEAGTRWAEDPRELGLQAGLLGGTEGTEDP